MFSKKVISLRKVTMFLEGLMVLLPLYLGINTPYFTIRRFNIPESNVDLYITKINITMQLGYFLGIFVANLYFYLLPRSVQKHNKYISVITNWLTVVSSVLLLFSYIIKGEEGSLLLYYYTLALCALVFGLNEGFAVNVGVSDMPWFTAAVPASGLVVVIYQLVFNIVAKRLELVNRDFTLITCQLSMIIFVSCLTSILWMICFLGSHEEEYDSEAESELESIDEEDGYYDPEIYSFCKRVWLSKGPFIASAFGFGLLYGFYPAIVPYKLTELKSAYYIDLIIISAISVLAMFICLLCEYTKHGPNKNWKETRSGWSSVLLLVFPMLGLPVLFIGCLHFPEVKIFKLILQRRELVGVLGIVFGLLHSCLTSVGYAASSKQTNRCNDPDMAPLNVLISYIVMIIVIIYSQGYLTFFAKVSSGKESIPEDSRIKTFLYWVGSSFMYGWTTFKNTITTDIRADILDVKK